MKNINFKRFTAYLIDLLIISVLVTLISQIKILNPYNSKYIETSEKFKAYYTENIETSENISYKQLFNKEYINIMHDLSKYSVSTSIIEIITIIAYFTAFPLLFNGQTIGKKICKLKICSKKGKLKFHNLLIRTLFYPIWTSIVLYTPLTSILLVIVVFLFKGFTYFYLNLAITIIFMIYCYVDVVLFYNKESIHDKLSNTKVLEVKKGEVL